MRTLLAILVALLLAPLCHAQVVHTLPATPNGSVTYTVTASWQDDNSTGSPSSNTGCPNSGTTCTITLNSPGYVSGDLIYVVVFFEPSGSYLAGFSGTDVTGIGYASGGTFGTSSLCNNSGSATNDYSDCGYAVATGSGTSITVTSSATKSDHGYAGVWVVHPSTGGGTWSTDGAGEYGNTNDAVSPIPGIPFPSLSTSSDFVFETCLPQGTVPDGCTAVNSPFSTNAWFGTNGEANIGWGSALWEGASSSGGSGTVDTGTVGSCGTDSICVVTGNDFVTSWTGSILVNGIQYTISSVPSTTKIVLTTSPGNLTGVTYSFVPSPQWTITAEPYQETMAAFYYTP